MADASGDPSIQDIYAALVTDEGRNAAIVRDVAHAVESGRSPLVLTGRTEHLSRLESALSATIRNIVVLKGRVWARSNAAAFVQVLAGVPDGEQRLILATGSYIGEGFDDARLDTLFLAMPISWKGTLQQYVGRLHRLHDTTSAWLRSMITSTPTSGCWRGCMIDASRGTVIWAIRSVHLPSNSDSTSSRLNGSGVLGSITTPPGTLAGAVNQWGGRQRVSENGLSEPESAKRNARSATSGGARELENPHSRANSRNFRTAVAGRQ